MEAPSQCQGLYIYDRLGSQPEASKARATRVGKHKKLLRAASAPRRRGPVTLLRASLRRQAQFQVTQSAAAVGEKKTRILRPWLSSTDKSR